MKGEEEHINFENSLAPWFGRTGKIVDYYLIEMFREANLDITKEQMVILKKLHEKNGMSQNELASITFRDKSSLARLLSKMEKKGYLSRLPNEGDKRINQVFLTNEGRDIFKQAKPIIKKIILTMEDGVTNSEKQQLIKILKKIQHNFKSSFNPL